MVIAFNTIVRGNLHLANRSQAMDRMREGDRGKVVCIARGAKAHPLPAVFESDDEPEYEPPKGA
jgi:hypothetical protein